MVGLWSKFYKAMLIRAIILVDISPGKEPEIAGFEGKL